MNWRDIDEKAPFSLKAEVWVGRNYIKILAGSIAIAVLGLLYGFWASGRNSDAVETLAKALAQMSNKVIVLTPDGRVAQVEKADLNRRHLELYLENFVLTNLVFDKFSFFKGRIYAPSFEKVPAYSSKVKRILEMGVFDRKNPQGYKNFKAVVEYLWSLGKADQLPEIIKPLEIEDKEFRYDPSSRSFVYRISLSVSVTYFTRRKKWEVAKGKYGIELAGYFNPLLGTPANPFGMKLTHLKIEPIKKPRR